MNVLQEQFENKFSQQRCELVLSSWRANRQFAAFSILKKCNYIVLE